jgi:hypothetical protein
MRLELHFCNDPSAWRYLIPTILDIPESQFPWVICRFQQNFTFANELLKSTSFSFVPEGSEEYVSDWLNSYGLKRLKEKVTLHWWGETDIEISSTHLQPIDSESNGMILDLRSRYPQRSLRSLLVERSVHPITRAKIRHILENLAESFEQMNHTIPPLPPPYSFERDVAQYLGDR